MCDAQTLRLLQEVVDEWVGADKMFTARDVTYETRDRHKLKLFHRDVKNDIHSLMDPYVSSGTYSRGLKDVGGPDGAANVYCPAGEDPNNYDPNWRTANSSTPKQGRFSVLAGLVPATTVFSPAAPAANITSGVRQDRRGRICVRASFLKSAGFYAGQEVSVEVESNKILLTKHLNGSPRYLVDKHNNVRISRRLVEKAGLGNASYSFSAEPGRVVVEQG